MQILINAANVTGAGAAALTSSLLPQLFQEMKIDTFFVAVPDTPVFQNLPWTPNSYPIFKPQLDRSANNLSRLYDLWISIPRQARKLEVDVCLTLGDVGPVKISCPHVIFLHQPLLVYDQQKELENINYWSPLKQKYLSYHFLQSAKKAVKIIVQTPVMAQRLKDRYPLPNHKIAEIAQAVPVHVWQQSANSAPHREMTQVVKPIKLLFLAAFYPHKNHRILPDTVKELRERRLTSKVHIFTTITREEARMLNLKSYADVISNLGTLPPTEVASALKSSTALFLPTLVESYGLVYLEAMATGKLVLTSNRDFARWMCKDLAIYFDPLDATSIVTAIEKVLQFDNSKVYQERLKQRIAEFPQSWQVVARQFADVLYTVHSET